MKTPRVVSWSIAGFAVGAVLGHIAGVYFRSIELQRAFAQLEVLRSKADSLAVENRRLTNSLRNVPPPQRSSAQESTFEPPKRLELPPLEKLRVLVEFQQGKVVRPALTFLNREGELDESFATLFALSPSERTRLQDAVINVREKLANLERSNAKVSRDDRGNIVVAVQPFPAEGGKVYDEIMQIFSNVLGPERNDAFRKIGAEQFEISLGRFGAAERTYTFGYDSSERPGQPYTFQDRVMQRSSGGGLSGNTNNTRFRTFDELAARVGPIVSILPPEFNRSK